jgi:hypothetical protein
MRVSSRPSGTNNKITDSINGRIFLEQLTAYCLLREKPTSWDYQFIMDDMQPVKMSCQM